jgi:hypothetical protein
VNCQVPIRVVLLQLLTHHSEKSRSSRSDLYSWNRGSCFESRPGHRLSWFFHDFLRFIQANMGIVIYFKNLGLGWFLPCRLQFSVHPAVTFDSTLYLYTWYSLPTIRNNLIFNIHRYDVTSLTNRGISFI